MKQHITNPPDATANMHVGGTVIRPGETRYCDVPGQPGSKKQASAPEDPLEALAKGTVKDVVAALPDLSDEDLARLRELEAADKDRSTLLEAIDEAILDRAGDNSGTGEDDEGNDDDTSETETT